MWSRTSEKRNRNNTLHNRSSTIETAHNTKSFYTHPLPFWSVAGVRNLHRCSHLACYRCSSLLGRFIFQHQPTYSQLVAYHDGHSRLHRMQRGNPKKGSCSRQVFVMPGDGKLLGRDIQGSPDQGTKKSEGRQRSIHCRQL